MRKRERSWGAPLVVTAAPLLLSGALGVAALGVCAAEVLAQPAPAAAALPPLKAGDVVMRDERGQCSRSPGPCEGEVPCGPAVPVACPYPAPPPNARIVEESPGFCMVNFNTTCPPSVPCNPPSPVPGPCPGDVTIDQVTIVPVRSAPVIGPGNPPGFSQPQAPPSAPATEAPKPPALDPASPLNISRNPPARPSPPIGSPNLIRPPAPPEQTP